MTLLLLAVMVTAGAAVWASQRLLIYPGAMQVTNLTLPLPEGVEVWERPLPGGGVVEALLIPARPAREEGEGEEEGEPATRPGPAVVFLHGNGEMARQWPHEMDWYARHGITVLIPEYRGFDRSSGRPGEAAILDDLSHFVERLAASPAVDPARLIYHGRSLGTGFAAQLTARRRPAALILGSAFTSLPDAAHDLTGLPRWMVRDKLRVAAVLRSYGGPVLLIHGEDDRVIPVAHAAANAAAAAASGVPATRATYSATGHNNMPRGHGRWEDIEAFLKTAGLLPSPAAENASADPVAPAADPSR